MNTPKTSKPTVALPTVSYPSIAAANRAAVLALGSNAAFTTKPDGKGAFTWTAGTANKPAEPKTFAKAIVATAKATAKPATALSKALKASVAKPNAKPAKTPATPAKGKGRVLPTAALGGKAPEAGKPSTRGKGVVRDRSNWAKPYDTRGATLGARVGTLPPVPDFSAPTHSGYRDRLAGIVAMVEKGDIDGLLADTTEAKSSSRNAIVRYRDLAIFALQAQAAGKAARAAKKAAKVAAPAKPAKGKGKPASQPSA